MPVVAATRAQPPTADQSRRASGRQVRASISRPTNYYARSFGPAAGVEPSKSEDDPPGFFPALQAFSNEVASLPREVQRHLTLSKEAEAKIYAPVQTMLQAAKEIIALPPPPPPSHALAAQQAFLSFTANNSTGHNSANASVLNGTTPGLPPLSVAEAVDQLIQPSEIEQQTSLMRRQEFRNLRLAISQVLPHLDEKAVCINDATRKLDKQLARMDKILTHVNSEISEETRLGSITHWAYADNRKKTLPAQAQDKSRRDVAATSNLAAAATVIHEGDIAAARSGRDGKKARAAIQPLDYSEVEEKGPARKGQAKGKRAADAATDSKIAGSGQLAGQAQKKRKVEKPGGVGMERTASNAKNAKSAVPVKTAQASATTEAAKKERRPRPAAPPPARKKNGNAPSPAMSPQHAGSPTMAIFPTETNGQRPGSRMRQSSSSIVHSKLAREASSAGDKRANGDRRGTSTKTSDAMEGVESTSNAGNGRRVDVEPNAAQHRHTPTARPATGQSEPAETSRTRTNGSRSNADNNISTHATKSSAATDSDNQLIGSTGSSKRSHNRHGSSQNFLKQIASFNRSPTIGRRELPSGADESSTGGDEDDEEDDEQQLAGSSRAQRTSRSSRRRESQLRSEETDDEDRNGSRSRDRRGRNTRPSESKNEDEADLLPSRSTSRRQQPPRQDIDEAPDTRHDQGEVDTDGQGPEAGSPAAAAAPSFREERDPGDGRSPSQADAEPEAEAEADEDEADPAAAQGDEVDEEEGEPQDDEESGPPIYGGLKKSDFASYKDDWGEQYVYCHCGGESFGTMIACENLACPMQWFHLSCVGMTKPPPDDVQWYCDWCMAKTKRRKGPPRSQPR